MLVNCSRFKVPCNIYATAQLLYSLESWLHFTMIFCVVSQTTFEPVRKLTWKHDTNCVPFSTEEKHFQCSISAKFSNLSHAREEKKFERNQVVKIILSGRNVGSGFGIELSIFLGLQKGQPIMYFIAYIAPWISARNQWPKNSSAQYLQ